jgi:hypothetical protein
MRGRHYAIKPTQALPISRQRRRLRQRSGMTPDAAEG